MYNESTMSLLIKGVQIVDGEGSEPYKADVLVQRDVISASGNLKGRETDMVIDGLGNYLTPGFIDVHTNADHYLSLFTNPSGEDFLQQGITTIIGGHCGSSLAPLIYGNLESIRKWSDPHDINVDWHTVAEFLKSLEKISLGVNFGTLVGHSTIRRALVGDRSRLLTKELDVFKEILGQAMDDGAFGFSTGLGYVHGRNASKKELNDLVSVLAEFNGVYTTHLRNETDKLVVSVNEVIEISKSTGVRALISHLMPIKKYEKEYGLAMENIEKNSREVYFDVYPYETTVRAIYTLLPVWAQVENLEMMLERVRNKKTAEFIARDLKGISSLGIVIAGAPHHEYLVGKTLREIADNLKITLVRALIYVMDVTDLRATAVYKNVSKGRLLGALMHKRAFIASHGSAALPGEFMKHERSTNAFPEYLDMVVGSGKLDLPEAVARITSKPAQLFNLKKRGVIKEGNAADLVVLGKSDYQVKHVVLGGRVFGKEPIKGEVLRHKP